MCFMFSLILNPYSWGNCYWGTTAADEQDRDRDRDRDSDMELKNMVALVSRTGRQMQRYNFHGQRQVVGCIPYRYKGSLETSSITDEDGIEVLVITSQRKGKGMLFPKGGWETDESIEDAALRETMEEAGVVGEVELKLGTWNFKSKAKGTYYEGHMFPLLVTEQLEFWPEKNSRKRIWLSVGEARKVCQYWWMKDALEVLVKRMAEQDNEVKWCTKSNL